MTSPSATLTVWASSWLAGKSAPDNVIDALHEWAPMHLVCAENEATAEHTGLPWPDPRNDGVAALLSTIRRAAGDPGARLHVTLPGPGDVRGLPAGTSFATAAIDAGEGVLIGAPGSPGLGLVPRVEGPDVLRWTGYTIDRVPLDLHHTGLGEAEYCMREAVRDAATALETLELLDTGSDDDPRELIADALARTARHRYPSEVPARMLRIMDSADQVAAILVVAEKLAPGRTVSATGATAVEDLLRPLWSAVRSARSSAVNSAAAASA
ncbi:hypothetical protein [Rhodococcus sp. WMMA185]|uniref:hypothetical protein n=1 Tax=Rhodococcus sp. WMMA185 TaxID=679318 RepID=UPI000878CC47|nr:hypothetical protein [Rhodococcus sp. WMMA185]